ncbi:MAG: ATP-binding cassette domain-containing protein [Actinomycetales bacterium]|nr:ATP-binding cassette domain-containing protein [Actinomycetales bacterium]
MKLIWRTLRGLLPLLPGKARQFLAGYVVASASLALLDIAALGLLALSLAPMVQGEPVELPLVGRVEPSGYVGILVVVSALIIVKGLVAIGVQWVVTRRFARYELEIGDRLFAAYIRAPWTDRLARNTSQLVRLADVGIANATAGFLLPVAGLPALGATFLAVLVVLVVAEPVTAALTLGYLGVVGVVMYFFVSRRAITAGRVNRDYSFRVARLMTEMVGALKEITLRDKAGEVAAVVHADRRHTTRARANLQFLGAMPRYVLESALVGGFLLIGGVAYATGGAGAAFSALALFGVAGFRMVPAVTSFQAVIAMTASNIPNVEAVIGDIQAAERYVVNAETVGRAPFDSEPELLSLRDVAFTYPGATEPAVRDVHLDLPMGSSLALVGRSGAGKTTLVDILLGLLEPSTGSLTLDERPLADVLAAWRARVGYVPQDVALFDASLAQNVALTWTDDLDLDRVRDCLERAQLGELVAQRGLDARIGDRGMALSGGQRQRLGIARALYVDPLVLVLDEATSALDTQTEASVSAAIAALRGEVTVIAVAHRLSTVRSMDQVCFMAEGTIAARGTFDDLVAAVPDFAAQAQLAGLVE